MSKFKTAIAVDVESVKGLLPKGSFLHGVEWNKDNSSVELTWEHDALKTKYSFASDYPLAKLREFAGLNNRPPADAPENVTVAAETETVAPQIQAADPEAAPAAVASAAGTVRTGEQEVVEKPRRRR